VGEWTVFPELNSLERDGSTVHLEPKVMQVLVTLSEQPSEVVSKEQIFKRVWSGTFVSDEVLTRSISELRKAFEDNPQEPKYIQTIPKGGYRLVATVVREPANRKDWYSERWRMLTAATAVLLLAAVASFYTLKARKLGASKAAITSLAVLPLANLSSDPQQEYFVDGMTDALITELGKVSALRVISRQSMMRYKGAKKSAPQIAKELNVEAILEGSVVRSGDRVRISVQLVQAFPERHLWVNSYDRDLRDVLALHSEIARTVAGQVRVKLTLKDRALLASAPPVNPEAYESYLHGAHLLSDEYNADSAQRAIPHFERAISLDPGSALPYCGLAAAHAGLGHLAAVGPREAFPAVKAAALKAQELDDNVACAHWALAEVHFLYDWDWAAAEKEYRRAIELKPGSAELHNGYAHFLNDLGRNDEGFTELKRAMELDPAVTLPRIGFFFYFARQYDEAIRRDIKLLDATPNFSIAHLSLGLAYEQKRDFSQAIPELKRAMELSGDKVFPAFLAHSYAVSGNTREAKRILEELKQPSGKNYVDPWAIALVYAGLGEKDRAMEWLEMAYENRDHDMAYCKVWPHFDPLRSDPRFQDLLRRMNLPP